jgi:hypothetical protein
LLPFVFSGRVTRGSRLDERGLRRSRPARMKIGARKAMAAVFSAVAAAIGGAVGANTLTAEATAVEPPTCPETAIPGATVGSFESQASVSTPQRYAPLVFLHPDEELLPMAADCFIANSSLEFAEGRNKQSRKAERGELTAERLVRPGYEHGGFTTRERTRPFASGRAPALVGRRGFYLDLEDRFRSGARSTEEDVFFAGTPVYYEHEPGRHITYWFFYGFSAPAAKLVRPLRRRGIRSAGHEGDWEGISIKLDEQDAPVSVRYFAHGEKVEPVPWAKVKKLDGHPIVFSALGSHASYAMTRRLPNLDLGGGGPIWATWLLVADARVQPWYGYGGAWGVARTVPGTVRAVAAVFRKKVGRGEFTGPLGPPFKASPFDEPAKATASGPVG